MVWAATLLAIEVGLGAPGVSGADLASAQRAALSTAAERGPGPDSRAYRAQQLRLFDQPSPVVRIALPQQRMTAAPDSRGVCRSPSLQSPFRITAAAYRLDPRLLDAVAAVESGRNPGRVSRKGAIGLMQVMSGTASAFGVTPQDLEHPRVNLATGAAELRRLSDAFNGDLVLTLAAYNAGEGAVRRYGNTLPPFPETRAYVARVLNVYDRAQRAELC